MRPFNPARLASEPHRLLRGHCSSSLEWGCPGGSIEGSEGRRVAVGLGASRWPGRGSILAEESSKPLPR